MSKLLYCCNLLHSCLSQNGFPSVASSKCSNKGFRHIQNLTNFFFLIKLTYDNHGYEFSLLGKSFENWLLRFSSWFNDWFTSKNVKNKLKWQLNWTDVTLICPDAPVCWDVSYLLFGWKFPLNSRLAICLVVWVNKTSVMVDTLIKSQLALLWSPTWCLRLCKSS